MSEFVTAINPNTVSTASTQTPYTPATNANIVTKNALDITAEDNTTYKKFTTKPLDADARTEDGSTPYRRIPSKAFDAEYMTERIREVRFLHDRGIDPTYVRETPTYHVRQFKYKKTPTLFANLVEFYSMLEAERLYGRKPEYKQDDTE